MFPLMFWSSAEKKDGWNNNKLCLIVLIHVDQGELAPETYKLYLAQSNAITTAVTAIPSNHLPPFTMVHSITRFLSANHSYSSPQPGSMLSRPTTLSASLNLQSNTFHTHMERMLYLETHSRTIAFSLLCHALYLY